MTEEISYKFYTSSIPRLDPEEKKLWLEALLSGKFKQGMGKLRTHEGGFCCLGVYCEVKDLPSHVATKRLMMSDGTFSVQPRWYYGKDTDTTRSDWSAIPSGYGIPFVEPYQFSLNEESLAFNGEEAIFTVENTPMNYGRESYTLQNLNDRGFSFKQIADLINYFL